MPSASQFWRSPDTDNAGARILPFPSVGVSQAAQQSELGGALSYGSPENLVNEAIRIMGRIAHLASSLSEDQRITLLGELLALETGRLNPLADWVARRRTFLSDLSAKMAKKRRRRQKRVKAEIPKIA